MPNEFEHLPQCTDLHLRYPNGLAQPPFEKWIQFQVRGGRHIGRSYIHPESGTNIDRVLSTVSLYLSESALRDSITINYNETSMGTFMGAAVEYLAQTGDNIGKLSQIASVGDAIGTLTSAFGAAKREFAANAKEAIQAELQKGDVTVPFLGTIWTSDASSSLLGTKANPRTDLLFDSQQYRTKELDFLLIPRNIQEAKTINSIITLFQFYSLPAYLASGQSTAGAFLLGFPYEFTIDILHRGKTIETVNKIGRSVLRNVTIDHAAGGKTAFVEAEGQLYPVATKLSLAFQEVRLLGRGDVEIQREGTEYLDDSRRK